MQWNRAGAYSLCGMASLHGNAPFADDRRGSHEPLVHFRDCQCPKVAEHPPMTAQADTAGKSGRRRRARSRIWLRRFVEWFLAIAVALPIALILLFRFFPVPTTPYIVATWIREGAVQQHSVSLDQVSPNLVRAVIA